MSIAFGDNVRVLVTPVTEAAALGGLVGNVHGITTPSLTGVDVIGELANDVALNVFFENRKQGYWFAENLLEFVDHSPGSTLQLDGVPKKWTRQESGDWLEEHIPAKRTLWECLTAAFRRDG